MLQFDFIGEQQYIPQPIPPIREIEQNKLQQNQTLIIQSTGTSLLGQMMNQSSIKQVDNTQRINQISEREKKYFDFFRNVIIDPEKYVIEFPSDQEERKHKIKILTRNKYQQQLHSFYHPKINIRYTERQGTIVVYTVIIAIFQLQITLLNIDQDAKIQQNTIGSGTFGTVRIQSENKRMFAVKRLKFRNRVLQNNMA